MATTLWSRLKSVIVSNAIVFLVVQPQTEGREFDLAINNGRVTDPESRLDAVRHVAINGDKIAAISESPLKGKVEIDAPG